MGRAQLGQPGGRLCLVGAHLARGRNFWFLLGLCRFRCPVVPVGPAGLSPQLGPQFKDLLDQLLFRSPTLFQTGQTLLLRLQLLLVDCLSLGGAADPERQLSTDDLQLGLQRLDVAAAIVDLGGHRVLADRHPCARGVKQADRLVGQLTGWNVAVGQLDRSLQRLVQHQNPVMLLQRRGRSPHHEQRLGFVGLAHLHDLESPGQCRILFNVLLVLGPCGGRDGAQLATRQGRLEQIGCVAGARCASCPDQGMGLVDEQDDW